MKNANGYYSIPDLVKKMYHLDNEAFDTEWLCKKPSRKHLVYSKFDENIHVINCDFNSSFPLALSNDWGGVDPFVVLVWQEIPGRGSVIVDEFYQDNIDNPRVIELCKSRKWWPYAQRKYGYGDPARQDLIREWRSAGILMQSTKSGLDDISMVRTRLAPMRGDPTLYINRKCKMTIWEFNHYRKDKNDHPLDRDNHAMDCVRYYIRGTYRGEAKRPRVSLGHSKDLLGRPLSKWPFWKGDK
ncbi:unnamed protein product [marine sediment metagenome]|uniref:Terminase large subunit gp17-like C-terminal domain-containing protein n=1 Tax=marine sediment metagenome TaxID=412755 RepID=X0ZLV0_9ZZZZ